MKKLKYFLLFLVNYLPLLSCLVYRLGFISWLLAIGLFFVASILSYKYCDKPLLLVFYCVNSVISTPLAIYINTHLYVHYITDSSDYGTFILGEIFIYISLAVTIISSIILCVKKRISSKA